MRMVEVIFVVCVVFVGWPCEAERKDALCGAYKQGAVAHIRCRVVDEHDEPIHNATAYVSFRSTSTSIGDKMVRVDTDRNGIFDIAHLTNWKVECLVKKHGYYDSRFDISFYDTELNRVESGMWVHRSLNQKIVLRKVLSRKELIVFPDKRRMGTWKIPLQHKWVGFDFEKFDWTFPYGTGNYEDVLLRFSSEAIDHIHGKYQMEVCFTNNPCAGAYVGSGDSMSDLKTPHFADASRNYVASFCFQRISTGTEHVDNFPKKGDYIVFRTRTRTDKTGRLVASCYGVISGAWISSETTMRMEDSCFNPQENGLCIEDGFYLRELLRKNK